MNLSIFTVFLKSRNITSKIKRSKVTDYAALIIWENESFINRENLQYKKNSRVGLIAIKDESIPINRDDRFGSLSSLFDPER